MSVARKVATYYQNVNAAVADWRAMIDDFEKTFALEGGGDLWSPEDDSPVEPYRYRLVKPCGNLVTFGLAESIRRFVRAVQRVGKYVSTDRSQRINLGLLEDWASEIELVSITESSEKLVGLFYRVEQAFAAFAEEVECDAAIASLKRKALSGGKGAEDTNAEPPNTAPKRPSRWPDDDRDAIRDSLSNQQLKLFNVLWAEDRWTYYGDLKSVRADKLWRGQPDSDSISDDTVFEALRKLQKAMQPDWPYGVTIEHESKRAKIIPPEEPSP